MKYAFAGDRSISCDILKFIIARGYKPEALFVSDGTSATHSRDLIAISGLQSERVFYGNQFKQEDAIRLLRTLELDYIFGIHFPYIIPKTVLDIPKIGFLNLHPAYLPFNKGWHTPSWAILDNTAFGATLHFMGEALDEGDIIHQAKIEIEPSDTANSLYAKVLELEKKVFFDSFESLISLKPPRVAQIGEGTSHVKKDLQKVQEINIHDSLQALDLINKLRALTTNKPEEAAFFIMDGKKIGVQVKLFEMDTK